MTRMLSIGGAWCLLVSACFAAAPAGGESSSTAEIKAAEKKTAETKAPPTKTPATKAPETKAPATKGSETKAPPATAKPAEKQPENKEPAAETGPLPGHSAHGETFDDGPRQAAVLIPGCGNVHFPVTSKVAGVQAFIDQGVGQLHGFWYFEAERSFRQAAALDPQCAIAYWGMCMANVNNDKRARGFIAEALKHKALASPREQAWIDGLNEMYADPKKKDSEKRQQLVRKLEGLVHDYPDDLEAKAFLLLTIYLNHSRQLPITSHEAVDALAREILAKNDKHPIHHYRIHLWDKEKPQRALLSAAWCGPSAPAIAHMWHMPGHTYSNLKRYSDAVWQQEAASRVDHGQMMQFRIMPDQIHNYAHNHEWLIRNLNFIGEPRRGIAYAQNLIEMPRHPKHNGGGKSGAPNYGRQRIIELLSRYELWDDAIRYSETGYLDPLEDVERDLPRVRLLGASYFATGKTERGLKLLTETEARLKKVQGDQTAAVEKAEKDAQTKKLDAAKTTKAKDDAKKPLAGKVSSLESAIASLKANEFLAAGKAKEALEQYQKAGVSKELLSRVQLAAGDKEAAEKSAAAAKMTAQNQFHPWANYADVLYRSGKLKEAEEALQQARKFAPEMELDLPIVRRLAPLAKELKLPENWRLAAAPAADLGPRPSFDSLGPIEWRPTAAPDFRLNDASGNAVTLSQFRGKPVVLIFYLGFGCVHCVEQLRAFKPLAAEYEKAGISLLAISTDSLADVQQSLATAGETGKYPFPILSDHKLDFFKAYRAYDDFESKPLHATLLVDRAGQVRWQDIGFEPFSDAKFLLGESQRLLSLGHKQP